MIKELQALRVLMVTPRYFPYVGGIETHVHEVGRRLVRNGVSVTLLTTAPYTFPAPIPREENVEGMHVIGVQAWPRRRDYYLAPEIYSIIKHGKWDLVHCQGCHTFVPPMAMLAAKEAGIPYIVTFHTGGHSSQLRRGMRHIQWRLLRPLLNNAAKLIGVSHFEADYFRDVLQFPGDRFAVIPNGISVPKMNDVPAPIPQQTLIVSVGRLERYKGHQHLITALPKIRARIPTTQLLILGAGPFEANLHALAQKVRVAEHVEIRSVPAADRQTIIDR